MNQHCCTPNTCISRNGLYPTAIRYSGIHILIFLRDCPVLFHLGSRVHHTMRTFLKTITADEQVSWEQVDDGGRIGCAKGRSGSMHNGCANRRAWLNSLFALLYVTVEYITLSSLHFLYWWRISLVTSAARESQWIARVGRIEWHIILTEFLSRKRKTNAWPDGPGPV